MQKSQRSFIAGCFALLFACAPGGLPAMAEEGEEDPNLTIADVMVEGNRLVPTEDILGVVRTRRGDKFDREQVLQDLKAVNGLGYFDDRNMQVVPELGGGGVLLKIRVQENAPVTGFSFQGNQVLSSEEISKLFADQLGKPQNLAQLSSAIDKVEQSYHEKGYVLARVVDVKDDPDGTISLTINEGTVGDIQVVGNKKTKNFIIKNAIKLKPGAVYNERQLTGDLRKLYANGYFNDIRRSLAPDPNDPDKYILKVEVDEKRTGSVGLGGGVDTIAGPFGSLSFADSNFRGRGQVIQFNAQAGSGLFGQVSNALQNGGTGFMSNRRTYNIEATWIEPNLKGTNTSMAVSGFFRDFNSLMVDDSMQRTVGASVNFARPIGKGFTANLGFTGETTKLFDVGGLYNQQGMLDYLAGRAIAMGRATTAQQAETVAAQVRNQQLKGGAYLTVNPSIAYDTRDSVIDPSKGTVARLTASPSVGLTGGAFAKLGASASKFVPVGKNATLAFNVQGGTALGALPQFANYRLGGWNGIRGYRAFSDLGSGSSLLMATAEMRFKLPVPGHKTNAIAHAIHKNVKGVFFVDAGAVGGNVVTNDFFQRSALGASVGFGLRVNVPMMGLVRIDYGLPIISSLLGRFTPRVNIGFGEKF